MNSLLSIDKINIIELSNLEFGPCADVALSSTSLKKPIPEHPSPASRSGLSRLTHHQT